MNANVVCIAPNKIEDGDLLAHLAGEGSTAVSQHIQACTHCQNELAALQQLDGRMDALRFRASCPEPIALLRYVANLLTAERQQLIQTHSLECPHCQSELQLLAETPEAVRGESDAPQSRIKQWQAVGKQIIQTILQPPLQAAPALRGQQAAKEYLYLADDYQLVISQKQPLPTEPRWQIEGQLTPLQLATKPLTGTAVLVQNKQSIAEASLNEMGYFSFTQVKPNSYSIEVVLADDVILIEPMQSS